MIGVDTNIILNILRSDDPPAQREGSLKFFHFAQQKKLELTISVITLTELFRKPFRNKSIEEEQKVDSFLHTIDAKAIALDSNAAVEAARLIEEMGINFADALISASLSFAGIRTFVTRNVEDYTGTALEILTPEEFVMKYK